MYTWFGIELPGRKHEGGQKYLPHTSLPKITIPPIFEEMKTLEDVEARYSDLSRALYSSVACYISVNQQNQEFFHDQHGAYVWKYSSKLGVYTHDRSVIVPVCETMGEFFTRVQIESSIWTKWKITRNPFLKEEQSYLEHYGVTDKVEELD
jgi:hypothetical protein